MTVNTLLVFGLGFTARRLAARLDPARWRVVGTCRTPDAAADLSAAGVEVRVFDGAGPPADGGGAAFEPALIDQATHILVSAPPGPAGDPMLRAFAAPLARRGRDLAWLGYLSTTGVYGDRGGGWVDEDDPLTPTTQRGHRRLAAEQAWLALAADSGLPVHLFRLVGIYGPGRSAVDQVLAGTARRIDKPGQVFNRVHVDDIAAVLTASMAAPRPGRAYNVADDLATPPQDVVAEACRLTGRPLPPLIAYDTADLSAMARSFYAENKRVRNDRIKRELAVTLTYPTYREGLAQIWRDHPAAAA